MPEEVLISTDCGQDRESCGESIDFSKWFMPPGLTPLPFTGAYGMLSERQQLRYNQIQALYFHEQTIFFEKALAPNMLDSCLALGLPADLREDVGIFMREEEEHSAMFLDLNRRCAPEWYRDQDFYFIRVSPAAGCFLNWMARHPAWFPLFLWLAHLQEERALYFGKTFLKCSLPLEEHFRKAQRRHLADEPGHLKCDQKLLDAIWPGIPFWLRKANARLLAWMIGEYFSFPKRAGLRVIDALAGEFPDLRQRNSVLKRALLDLEKNPEFGTSLYNREVVPETFRRFDAYPEFHCMAAAMPGYQWRGGGG